ncbi:MAG TPA: class I SAM-dependent methyltransferase [Candidatus Omnitrophota bacterium]|nr:class I SAM-dependent methyltransferase [Candidatus Omnitrophota bacterium]
MNGLYSWMHDKASRPDERGEYSSGVWQDQVRKQALAWCGNARERVLEAGCGEGLFLSQLRQQNPGLELWGIDTSKSRIEQAAGRISDPRIHLSVGDASRLPFPDDFFDTAVCINVVFNMPSFGTVRDAFVQMSRVVKKGGQVIFDFRNAANPLLAVKYGLAPWYDKTVRDLPLKTYYMRDMDRLLKDLGLEVIEKKFIGTMALFGASVIMMNARKI